MSVRDVFRTDLALLHAPSQVPAGGTVSRARHRIIFSGASVRLVVLASPAGGLGPLLEVPV